MRGKKRGKKRECVNERQREQEQTEIGRAHV